MLAGGWPNTSRRAPRANVAKCGGTAAIPGPEAEWWVGNARQEGHWIAVRKVVQLRDYTIDADGLPRIAAHVASWPVLTDNLISRAKMPAASTMGHVGGSATPTEDTWRWSDPEDYRLNSGV